MFKKKKEANGLRKINVIQKKNKFIFLTHWQTFFILSINSLNFDKLFRKQDLISYVILLQVNVS